jgi:hypothetical protein
MKNKRDERIKDARTMRSIIIALIFKDREFEKKSLRCDMWRSAVYSFSVIVLIKKIIRNNINNEIFRKFL